MPYQLVVGLGNPGSEYQGTRHNVGFAVLDEMARQSSASFREETRGPAAWSRYDLETRLLKPLTYMNESGVAVRAWLDWLKLRPSDLFVIVDDVALPVGQLRLRSGGSHGGHNGLRSLEAHLGTTDYARLRCGVGPLPEGWPLERFVLGKFAEDQRSAVARMVKAAVDAFQCCQSKGISVAMQTFNAKLNDRNEEIR